MLRENIGYMNQMLALYREIKVEVRGCRILTLLQFLLLISKKSLKK